MREVDEAARKVQEAMRALDAHRQGSAPTKEREYLRALEAYFAVTEQALGRDALGDTAAEEEDGDALEDAAAGEELRSELLAIEGHFAAARRALRLARVYRGETGTSGRRERECVATVQRHREAIRVLRLRMRPNAEQLLLPGLAKTRPARIERVAKVG
ncbi:MAG TPA: hypothetical protein VGI39_45000 [Polyangiaceae bacterium]|jgi:hypothetical protein